MVVRPHSRYLQCRIHWYLLVDTALLKTACVVFSSGRAKAQSLPELLVCLFQICSSLLSLVLARHLALLLLAAHLKQRILAAVVLNL